MIYDELLPLKTPAKATSGYGVPTPHSFKILKQSFCRILRKKWSPIKNVLALCVAAHFYGRGKLLHFFRFLLR